MFTATESVWRGRRRMWVETLNGRRNRLPADIDLSLGSAGLVEPAFMYEANDEVLFLPGMTGHGLPPVDVITSASPGQYGTFIEDVRVGERELFLPFYIRAATEDELLIRQDFVRRLFAPFDDGGSYASYLDTDAAYGLGALRYADAPSGNVRVWFEARRDRAPQSLDEVQAETQRSFLLCTYLEGLEGETGGDAEGGYWAVYGVRLRAADPMLYGDEQVVEFTLGNLPSGPLGEYPDFVQGQTYTRGQTFSDYTFLAPAAGSPTAYHRVGPLRLPAPISATPEPGESDAQQAGYLIPDRFRRYRDPDGKVWRRYPFVDGFVDTPVEGGSVAQAFVHHTEPVRTSAVRDLVIVGHHDTTGQSGDVLQVVFRCQLGGSTITQVRTPSITMVGGVTRATIDSGDLPDFFAPGGGFADTVQVSFRQPFTSDPDGGPNTSDPFESNRVTVTVGALQEYAGPAYQRAQDRRITEYTYLYVPEDTTTLEYTTAPTGPRPSTQPATGGVYDNNGEGFNSPTEETLVPYFVSDNILVVTDAPCWPIFEIEGNAAGVYLVAGRTRLAFRSSFASTADKPMLIVTDPRNRQLGRLALTDDYGALYGAVMLAELDPFISRWGPMLPGYNEVHLGLSTGDIGQTKLRLRYRPRFAAAF